MKEFQRRQFLQLAAGAAALPLASGSASAQAYPSRPVRLVIGYTPGGSADLTARLMGQWLSEKLGQPSSSKTVRAAAPISRTEQALRATPDGYTLLLVAPANAINATLYEKLPFDFLKEMEPIAGIIRFPNVVVVHPSLPIKTIPELIAYAKANPGKLNMASSGNGSTIHMSGELFKMLTGIDSARAISRRRAGVHRHAVRHDGQVMFDNIPTCAEHVNPASRAALRSPARCVRKRCRTCRWSPTSCPATRRAPGTASRRRRARRPRSSTRLNKTVNEILADPKAKARFTELGAIRAAGSAAEFGKLVADETEKLGQGGQVRRAKVD